MRARRSKVISSKYGRMSAAHKTLGLISVSHVCLRICILKLKVDILVMNSAKRKYCGHCERLLNSRTHRLHFSLYYDVNAKKWRTNGTQQNAASSSDSSDDEEVFSRLDDDTPDINTDDVSLPEDSERTPYCTEDSISTQGAIINEMDDEDARLTGRGDLEDKDDWLYMEKDPTDDLFKKWELNENDIDLDFEENGHSSTLHCDIQEQRCGDIIRWMLIFLCMWSSYCYISDNALDILISFIHAVFQCFGTVLPAFAGMVLVFPRSLNLLKRQLGLDKDKFRKYVVCRKCETLYDFGDCYFQRLGRTVIKNCTHVAHDNHRQQFRRTACGEPLLKEVMLKHGRKRLYPFKVYCYNSIIDNLKHFISRPGFIANCELWRNRNVPDGILADVFDGRICKEFMYIGSEPFLAAPRNYAFMMNVDWFQPFKHSLYSVGAIYMVFMNLPREQRFKPENTILVGIIPGPHEPKLNINAYLKPLVDELNTLWNEGIQVKPPGYQSTETFRAALLCVGCDVPAARKVCGFTGHGSCHGCSKCKKIFPGNVNERMDFSGFDPCPPRTNIEHRQQAEDILKQTSATDKVEKEKLYGTRFTELMMLPYFDCVRFHIIDPMHNLFTGTAKHIMKNIWLDENQKIIEQKSLVNIQKKVDNVNVPSSVGRLPKKISNSYGGFTADQWKAWTIIYSVFALWNVLPQEDMDVWREFVIACSLLCSTIITETKARLGQLHLITFCKMFEDLYGKNKVTPNMHLHTHISDCILDFGPVYTFWLFSFERYNGILGEYSTNQRSVEIQIMRKFSSEQFVKALPLPSSFRDHFEPVFNRMKSKCTGTLQEYTTDAVYDITTSLISLHRLSIGPVRKGVHWVISESTSAIITIIAPISMYCIEQDSLEDLKDAYKTILNGIDEQSVTIHCEKISGISFGGEEYGSLATRKERSAFILARWCRNSRGQIDSTGLMLRPGVVNYFIRQNIQVNGQYHTFILASVRWFKEHPERQHLGVPVEVWCRDLYEDNGPADFIPFQRIHSKFVPAMDVVKNEHVLITCPLPRKLQC